MTPGLQAAISRLEGQWRNLFRRIRRIRRLAAILSFSLSLSPTPPGGNPAPGPDQPG